MAVYTKLKKKDIDTILENYSIGNLEEFDPIEEGVENTNYRILVNKKNIFWLSMKKELIKKTYLFFVL